jgi:hypothetical protein
VRMHSTCAEFCAVAQAVSHRPLAAEAGMRVQASPCEFCGAASGTVTAASPSTSLLPCQYHSPNAPYPFSHLLCRCKIWGRMVAGVPRMYLSLIC